MRVLITYEQKNRLVLTQQQQRLQVLCGRSIEIQLKFTATSAFISDRVLIELRTNN